MQPSPASILSTKDWTWQQRLRFFIIGLSFSAFAPLAPMVVCIWWDVAHWDEAIEWKKYGMAALTAMAQPAVQYWREKKALLKLPPGLVLPPEFQPSMQSKSIEVDTKIAQTTSGQPVLQTTKTTIEKDTHSIDPPPAA